MSGRFHITRAEAVSFADEVLGNSSTILAILAAAVVLLFLIACLNVGNLLLLRAAAAATSWPSGAPSAHRSATFCRRCSRRAS